MNTNLGMSFSWNYGLQHREMREVINAGGGLIKPGFE